MLTEECKNQEARLAEYEMQEQEYQEIGTEADLLRQQVESTRSAARLTCTECQHLIKSLSFDLILNVFIVKAYCVFDVMSYPLLTLTVILSILNKNLWFILIIVVGLRLLYFVTRETLTLLSLAVM